jgi:hypothetical protein
MLNFLDTLRATIAGRATSAPLVLAYAATATSAVIALAPVVRASKPVKCASLDSIITDMSEWCNDTHESQGNNQIDNL